MAAGSLSSDIMYYNPIWPIRNTESRYSARECRVYLVLIILVVLAQDSVSTFDNPVTILVVFHLDYSYQ
jgi:hypothetical protein